MDAGDGPQVARQVSALKGPTERPDDPSHGVHRRLLERIHHAHDHFAGAGVGEVPESPDVVGHCPGVHLGGEAGRIPPRGSVPLDQLSELVVVSPDEHRRQV